METDRPPFARNDPTPRPGDQTDDPTGERSANEPPTNRLTVADAARLLGTSAEAIRMRVKRGTLASEKVGGTVYVLLDDDQTRPNEDRTEDLTADRTTNPTPDRTALVEALRSEVEFLREELQRREEVHVEESRRKDHIIAALTQRIPELEAAAEPREAAEKASEASGDDEVRTGPEKRRSWLYRFFFGP